MREFEADRLAVVLVSTRNPLNIGAAARAMCNFGFQRLRVVNPYDRAFREARSAVGAAGLLANAEEFASLGEAIADCTIVVGTTAVKQRQLHHPLKTLVEGAPLICDELRSVKEKQHGVALLFGSEKFGLSNADLSYCHWLMHVPTSDEQPSMNLGQAVAVSLYELVRSDAKNPEPATPELAAAAELERMTSVLIEALEASGYMGTQRSEEKVEAVRRMIRRLTFTTEDATTCLGMLRQILWKLRTKS